MKKFLNCLIVTAILCASCTGYVDVDDTTAVDVIDTTEVAETVVSRFQRHVCVMEFTGTWCSQCPDGAVILNYLIGNAYKGKAFALAFHNDDIYALPQEQELLAVFGWSGGYPAYVVDMCSDMAGILNEGGCGPDIEARLKSMTHCGASLSCSYSEEKNEVTVKAEMFSELMMEYRMAVYVVEDKIKGEQKLGTNEIQPDYTHRHVVRRMLSSSVKGDSLGEVAAEARSSKEYTFTVEDEWNLENLSVYALVLDNKGHVNNMAVCEAKNGTMDYKMLNN